VVLEVKLRSYYAHGHIALFLTTWRVHELESLIQGLRLRLVSFAQIYAAKNGTTYRYKNITEEYRPNQTRCYN
jgi:hypothetical protein